MPKTQLIRLALAASVSTLLAGAAMSDVAWAQPAATGDPAAARIDSFDASLIKTMQAGKAAGASGRAKVVGPAVEQTFDLPFMTRLAVGPDWAKMSPDDQAELVERWRASSSQAIIPKLLVLLPDTQARAANDSRAPKAPYLSVDPTREPAVALDEVVAAMEAMR